MKRQKLFTSLILLLLALLTNACGASIDASKARSRGLINRGYIVPAEEVHVAEYLNYYEQRFPEPTQQPLALDVRLGNVSVPRQGGDVWMQIGLQAATPTDKQRTPLNLALVLDKSGSMKEEGKMAYLKESLALFLHSLAPDDIIAIVAYSDEAELLLPAQPVGDARWIQATIDNLQPDGWTNLHAGMMMGFREVEKHFDIRRNNRVILLTDGIANRGVSNPAQVAADAKAYNDRNIYLSTIGLGTMLDENLLHRLAAQGHGAYHFIDSPQEMRKVFEDEVTGLVEKVARDITLTLESEAGDLQYLVGYDKTPPARGAKIALNDMGAGDSQVVLAQFRMASLHQPATLAKLTLTYTDVFGQRQRNESRTITIYPGSNSSDPLDDVEVMRNVTIVRSAQALKRIDDLFMEGRYAEARELARQMEATLRRVAAATGDSQMVEDADLFQRYQLSLTAEDEAGSAPQQSQRWGQPTATPALKAITID
jgi:Ca-activated chloride channel family protein